MREIRTSGSMSGKWKRSGTPPPRHFSTLLAHFLWPRALAWSLFSLLPQSKTSFLTLARVTENGDAIAGASWVGAVGFFTPGVADTDSLGAMAALLKVGGLVWMAGFTRVAGLVFGLVGVAAGMLATVSVGRGVAAGTGAARGTNFTGDGLAVGVLVEVTGAGLETGTQVGTCGVMVGAAGAWGTSGVTVVVSGTVVVTSGPA